MLSYKLTSTGMGVFINISPPPPHYNFMSSFSKKFLVYVVTIQWIITYTLPQCVILSSIHPEISLH